MGSAPRVAAREKPAVRGPYDVEIAILGISMVLMLIGIAAYIVMVNRKN